MLSGRHWETKQLGDTDKSRGPSQHQPVFTSVTAKFWDLGGLSLASATGHANNGLLLTSEMLDESLTCKN